jgi:alkylation response protein AidB-like acyl-CoA dehydrogenase
MDFDFREEHLLFARSVRDFAEREIAPFVEEAETKEEFPVELFPKMGELGYLCVMCPEEYGGAGADRVSECLLMEELGKVCLGIASGFLSHSSVSTAAILHFGTEAQKRRYLVPAIKGERIAAFGLTEPNAGSDVESIETTARKMENGYLLSGAKTLITNATISDFVVVAAYVDRSKGSKGIALFVVDKGAPGFAPPRKLRKFGMLSADLGELSFEDCPLPSESVIGEEEGGFGNIMRVLNSGRMVVGARAVGLAQAAYEAALSYAQQRVQFGKPIGTFQAIAFKLADMLTQIEAARLLVYRAAWLYDQGRPCIKEASMAKLLATEMALYVASEALQIHGGYGFIADSPMQRYFRDARFGTVVEGTSDIQRLIISRRIGLRS